MFAIINVKTGEFVYGTDYRYHPPHQRTSNRQMLTYPSEESARLDFLHRKCGKDYKIACLQTVAIRRLIE